MLRVGLACFSQPILLMGTFMVFLPQTENGEVRRFYMYSWFHTLFINTFILYYFVFNTHVVTPTVHMIQQCDNDSVADVFVLV